jgi:transposase
MSTSLLYHAFGIREMAYVRTEYGRGQVHFTVRQKREAMRCVCCGSEDLIRRGTVVRRFRSVPIGSKAVWIILPVQRVECRDCGALRQVSVPFADRRRSYTKAFERYALELCQCMTVQDVADHLDVSWDVIKEIHKRHLQKRFARPRLKDLTHIGIDEICVGRPRKFLTVVLDLHSGAVVFVGQGKGKDALKPFWKRLKSSGAKIKAVATDMGTPYVVAVLDNLPDAALVLDRFHVVKYFNDKLTKLRRQVQRGAEAMHKKVLKGTRWVLLKNPENLRAHEDPQKDERKRLQDALAINEPLMMAYYLKEDLRAFWEQWDKDTAERFLDGWLVRAEGSGVTIVREIAKRFRAFRSALLAWYDHRISTGPLEAANNKIKTLQRRAYGFRDREYFIWQIYAQHEKKYALVG